MRKEIDPFNYAQRQVDMLQQHIEFDRQGYDGHGIQSGLVKTRTLKDRRNRRRSNRHMNLAVRQANGEIYRRIFTPDHIQKGIGNLPLYVVERAHQPILPEPIPPYAPDAIQKVPKRNTS